MSNTDRIIASLVAAQKFGATFLEFRIGKYTGNGTSVVAALRRRGFAVTRIPGGSYRVYGEGAA